MNERQQALEQARELLGASTPPYKKAVAIADAILEARAQEVELSEIVEADTNMGCACRSLTHGYKTKRAAELRAQKGK